MDGETDKFIGSLGHQDLYVRLSAAFQHSREGKTYAVIQFPLLDCTGCIFHLVLLAVRESFIVEAKGWLAIFIHDDVRE
jgi:hypothetical protein